MKSTRIWESGVGFLKTNGDILKIGICQFAPVFGEVEQNLIRIENMLSERQNVNLWVLPELSTTGYLFRSRAEVEVLAEPFPDGRTIQRMAEFSHNLRTSVIMGIAEKSSEKLYNSAVILHQGEFLGAYRKIHLFNEEKVWFDPGNEPPKVSNINGVKVGVMICFDWIFPETARTLTLMGAQIIAHPANLVLPFCQDAMITRSIENRVFTVTTNRVGSDQRGHESLTFTGKSQLVDPKGVRLIQLSEKEEETAIVDIDPKEALDKQFTLRNHLLTDRRTELYRL